MGPVLSIVILAVMLVGEFGEAAGNVKVKSMPLTIERVSECALATLSSREKESSVLYLDPAEMKGGALIEIDRQQVTAPWDCFVAFLDLKPQANWGHACRYLFISRETGEVMTVDASTPPFLKGPARELRVIWKGPEVPDWAVAAPRR
jgi:hypothetical protein